MKENKINIEALPDFVKKELHFPQKRETYMFSKTRKAVLEVLRAGGVQNLNDIIISVYVFYDIAIKRNTLVFALHDMVKRGIVCRVGKGNYKITDKGADLLK